MAPTRPPGVKRTAWTRAARVADGKRQRKAWQRGKNAMVRVPRNKLNFPNSMRTKLRYTTREVFQPVIGAAKVRTFRGNSIYDPTYALGGHKPRGSDQFFAVYDTYTVVGSKIGINFMYEGYDAPSQANGGALIKTISAHSDVTHIPAQPPVVALIHRSSDDYLGGLVEAQMEKDKTNWVVMNPQADCKALRSRATTQEFFGKEALVGSEGYTGTVASNPTEEWFFHVICGLGTNGYTIAGLVTNITAYITIEYDVVFTDPKQLASS